jgi:hypothetical protein
VSLAGGSRLGSLAGEPAAGGDKGRQLRPRAASVFKRVLQHAGQLTQDLWDISASVATLLRILPALGAFLTVVGPVRSGIAGSSSGFLGRRAVFSALFRIGANGVGIEARCSFGRGVGSELTL